MKPCSGTKYVSFIVSLCLSFLHIAAKKNFFYVLFKISRLRHFEVTVKRFQCNLFVSDLGSMRRMLIIFVYLLVIKVRSKIRILFRKKQMILKILSNSFISPVLFIKESISILISSKIKIKLWRFVVCGKIVCS